MPQRYLVPQYIEVEPKMIGPITIRQFLELLYAGLVGFLFWKLFSVRSELFAITLIALHTFAWGIIAFTKINGQNFHYFALNIIRTLKKPKLRIWGKVIPSKLEKPVVAEAVEKIPFKPLPPTSKLSDLSLMVDTGGAYNVDLGKPEAPSKVEEIKI